MEKYLPFTMDDILEFVDKYATPFNVSVAVSSMILMSVALFMIDQFTSKSTSNSTQGKYAAYADENNDDPKDKTYDPKEVEEESSEDDEPTPPPVGVRRSGRIRANKKATRKAAKKKKKNTKKSK
eukprot:351186_1